MRLKAPELRWGAEEREAFETLKRLLTTPPILAYARYDLPFVLYTDASSRGLGAVLAQEQDGAERTIAYASRGLSSAEQNYPAHKLEFLALKWSVTDKFSDYLYGAQHKFTIFTDNNPLTYVLTTAKLDAAGHRWLAELANYTFDIKYRPGKVNINADILSRLPKEDKEYRVIDRDLFAAIVEGANSGPIIECLCAAAQVVDIEDVDEGSTVGLRELRRSQVDDPAIGPVLRAVTQKAPMKMEKLTPGTELHQLAKEYDKLRVRRGLLYRVIDMDGEERAQVVLPKKHRELVLRSLHNDAGHQGRDKTLSLIRDRFYWSWMARDVDQWIKSCDRCIKRRAPTDAKAPLVSIETSQPLELVCIDFLTLESSKGGYQHILVLTDHFTRYAQAIPTKDQTAKTTAEAIFNGYILHYGILRKLHSDQGANFNGKLIHELCKLTGMDKSRTTPYHPAGNGMCERFNRTLLNMLGTLEPDQKTNWKAYVGPLVHAYNATRHASTGHAPFYLMFGRQARLPIDLVFDTGDPEKKDHSKYITELRERLKHSYELATKEAEKSRDKQKQNYDVRARAAVLQPGDRVLVKILAHEGKHKIADHWLDEVYVVLKQPNEEVPVYIVQQEDGKGPRRKLHRNHLLPVSHLPLPPIPPPRKAKPQAQRKEPERRTLQEQDTRPGTAGSDSSTTDSEASDTESEYSDGPTIPHCNRGQPGPRPEQTNVKEPEVAEPPQEEVPHQEAAEEAEDSENNSETSADRDDSSSEDESLTEEEQEEEHPQEVAEEVQAPDDLGAAEDPDSQSSGDDSPAEEEQEDLAQDVPDTSSESGESDRAEEPGEENEPRGQPAPKQEPVPRRSQRERKTPARFKSNDFITYQCQETRQERTHRATKPDWAERAEFLATMAAKKTFNGLPDDVYRTILRLVAEG